jgi:hypothetical protein
MPTRKQASAFQATIARYERRLRAIQEIQELIAEDPGFVEDIRTALNGRNGATQAVTGSTNFDRVRRWFRDRNNAWASAPEISRALDISRGVLGQMLYVGHTEAFESKPKPGSRKRKLWRLRKDVLP